MLQVNLTVGKSVGFGDGLQAPLSQILDMPRGGGGEEGKHFHIKSNCSYDRGAKVVLHFVSFRSHNITDVTK